MSGFNSFDQWKTASPYDDEYYPGESCSLADFWLKVNALTNKPEAHPDIGVIICTLDEVWGVGVVELTQDEDGNWQLQINTDQHELAD